MDRIEEMNRRREFSGPIADIARDDVLVEQVINCYVAGKIATKEEALCQMVIILHRVGKSTAEKMFEMAKYSTIPYIRHHGKSACEESFPNLDAVASKVKLDEARTKPWKVKCGNCSWTGMSSDTSTVSRVMTNYPYMRCPKCLEMTSPVRA